MVFEIMIGHVLELFREKEDSGASRGEHIVLGPISVFICRWYIFGLIKK